MVSQSVCRLSIALDDGEELNFLPGQYVHISIPGTYQKRSYSVANSPSSKGILEFFIRLLDGGLMSEFLRCTAKKGDAVILSKPFGSFLLEETRGPILMVAGGTGLAPLLSMLDHLKSAGFLEHRVKLLFGVSRFDDLFCVERLRDYARRFQNFNYEIAVAERHPEWHGRVGPVTSLLDEKDIIEPTVNIYVCGPSAMTEATTSWLADHEVSDHRIHTEKFVPT